MKKSEESAVEMASQAMDEADIVERCRAGDRAAFGGLIALYQDRVFNLCLRMCGCPSDAEDYAQEAFIKAMQSIDRFDGRSRFYTWLFRIAVNVAISGRRKGGRVAMRSLDDGWARGSDDGRWSPGDRPASETSGPMEQAAVHEEHAMVLAALAELDDEHRAALVLRDVESLDYSEIAEVLGVAVGTVKSRLHRARLALRERLRPMMESPKNG